MSIQSLIKSSKIKSVPLKVVNISFLSPAIILFFVMCTFLVALILLPVRVNFELSIAAFSFFLLCFVSFLGGAFIGGGNRYAIRINIHRFDKKAINRFVILVVAIGCIGTVLLLVDRYFLRGVTLAADALENRENLGDTKASLISSIAALASSFGIIAYLMIWIAELGEIRIARWVKLIAISSFLATLAANIELGSRALLLVVMLVYSFSWFFIHRAQGRKIENYHILIMVTLAFILVVVNAVIMITRTELMAITIQDSIYLSAYAEAIEPSPFMRVIIDNSGPFSQLFSGLFSLIQYLFHGIYEFGYLFKNFQGNYEMGTQVFWLPIKVVSMMTGGWIPNPEFNNISVRSGVFNTFLGPVFIDYGLFSPLVMFIYGFAISLPYRWMRSGKIEWLPAVALISGSSVLWPVVNIFTSASGEYLLVVAIAIGLFGQKFSTKCHKDKLSNFDGRIRTAIKNY